MKNILLLTSVYPASDLPKETTPVVHYFAREWVKDGYNVLVINYISNFPVWMYKMSLPFASWLSSYFSFIIRTKPAQSLSYVMDGVYVERIVLHKFKPHGAYSKSELMHAFDATIESCSKNKFVPDCIIGHWLNPQLILLYRLKQHFQVPTVLVFHDWGRDLLTVFRKNADKYMNSVNMLGFRSKAIERLFKSKYNYENKTFYCYSGIPERFLPEKEYKRTFDACNNFIYIGTLIKRKYPAEILSAVLDACNGENFHLTYIGDGIERKKIVKYGTKRNCIKNISLLGRIDRLSVREQLLAHDIFIMISRNEAFGLVYLEAMSVGCITIAARDEGFDGIIEDGVNGFLCKAGDVKELASLIRKIRNMDKRRLEQISLAAIDTAKRMTDRKVARAYIEKVKALSN